MQDFFGVDRRGMLQQLAVLLGVATLPAHALAATGARAKKQFLTGAQFSLLSAIADTIIPTTDTPGAVAAGVPRLFDTMVRDWASAARRTELTGAIAEIDALAMTADKKTFAALSPARRKAILVEHDKAALKPGPPPKEKLSAFQAMTAGPPVTNPAYLKVKELVIALYYSSEIACTQEQVYEHVPGKFAPSIPVTPETRPFAGTGGLF